MFRKGLLLLTLVCLIVSVGATVAFATQSETVIVEGSRDTADSILADAEANQADQRADAQDALVDMMLPPVTSIPGGGSQTDTPVQPCSDLQVAMDDALAAKIAAESSYQAALDNYNRIASNPKHDPLKLWLANGPIVLAQNEVTTTTQAYNTAKAAYDQCMDEQN